LQTFSSGKKLEFAPKYGVDSPLYEHHTTSLVFNDPPLHTRVRRILLGALTTKNFERMEPNIQRLVNELVDAAEKKGTIDLIEDFSILIPIEVIGNLLDVPHHERGPLRKWSLYILGALEPTLTETQMKNGNNAVTEFTTYLRELVRKRKEKPGDPEVDLLTRLLQGEKDGEKLTESELLQNCVFLLNAGHETTSNLVSRDNADSNSFPSLANLALAPSTRSETASSPSTKIRTSSVFSNPTPPSTWVPQLKNSSVSNLPTKSETVRPPPQ
jgi:cytochrome P450